MTPDEIRKYCVIVNQGSGCIFQPLDETSSYILTAKHVIEDANNELRQLLRFDVQGGITSEIPIPCDQFQEGVNYFPHADKDIAIIKVAKIANLDNIIRQDVIDNEGQRFKLLGYPGIRRYKPDRADWLRIDSEVHIHNTKANGMIEAELDKIAQYAEIVGQSGGCYVRATDNYLNLIGIQNRIATQQQEYQGRVDFTPIRYFDDIVALYPDSLMAMLPPQMRCFSFVQAEAFAIDGGFVDADISMARQYLKNKTQEIIDSNTTPMIIKEHFKERLLIYSNDSGVLQSRAIWLVWLEFLTIIKIAKYENIGEEQLEGIFNSVRLLHSDTDRDWSNEMMNIMYSDFKGLQDDGIVIVSVAKEPVLDMSIIKPGATVSYITQAKRDKDDKKMNIDQGRKSPFDHFTFAHINCFKKDAILKKYQEYAAINDDDTLFAKLKAEFNELLRP